MLESACCAGTERYLTTPYSTNMSNKITDEKRPTASKIVEIPTKTCEINIIMTLSNLSDITPPNNEDALPTACMMLDRIPAQITVSP